jgi:arylsulfatase A-like enzyme
MAKYAFDYDEDSRKEDGVYFGTTAFQSKLDDGEIQLTPDDARYLNLLYEAKLRHVDQTLVAPLIEVLKDTGRYDNTLIVITSDHGEELYEHRGFGHGHALWEEVIHVPLIVKYAKGGKPEAIGDRVSATTRSIDVFPSLLARLGVEAQPDLSGVPALQGVFAESAFAERMYECTPVLRKKELVARRLPSPGDIHGATHRAQTFSPRGNRWAACAYGRWPEHGPGGVPESQGPKKSEAGLGCNGFPTL